MIGWLAKTWGFDGGAIESPESEVNIEYTVQTYSRSQPDTSNRTLDDIIVEGSNRFVNHVNRCLEEVRGTRWESLVCELRKIAQCSCYADSGVSNGIYEAAPESMGLSVWNDDCIEGASVLIHEAVHTKREFSGEFDNYDFAGEERIANAVQAEFLRFHGRYLRASDLENSDGRHNEPYMSAEFLAMQR